LYVEDNPADAVLMKKALEVQGEPFSLTILNDGQPVLDLLVSKDSSLPDLVILDLALRTVDGLTVLSALKKDDRWQNIPVVVFVGPNDPNAAKAAALSADFCHPKPMDWEGWPELVKQLLTLAIRADRSNDSEPS
jgi:CheY-like chemotaxis protein